MTNIIDEDISLLNLGLRHWRLILVVFFASLGLAGLLTIIMPRRYESQMKLLVNNERADLVITPEKNSPAAPPSEVSETEVNSEMELLRSHDILAGIVTDAKLYRPYQKKNAAPTRLAIEKAVVRLGKDLGVSAIRKTNIIEVKYRATDPDVAAFVLRDLSGRYLNEHLSVHSAPGTYKFFADELAKHRIAWMQAQSALSRFHRQKQLFVLPQQQAAAVGRLETVDAQLKDVDAKIQEMHTTLTEDQRHLTATPERVVTQVKQVPDQMASGPLQTMLTQLRNRRAQLAMKFKPNDRSLVEVDQEIENTESSLAAVRNGPATEQTTDIDPLHQSLKSEVVRNQVFVQALQTQRAGLVSMREAYLRQLDGMDQNAVALNELQQNEKEAQENYQLYSRRLEEVKLANSLDREKFANVAVIEQPVASPIPVSPSLPLNLAVGAVIGAFLGLLLAFLMEAGNNRRTDPEPTVAPDPFPARSFHAHASGD